MTKVTALWRHPIKSHGREALDRVMLTQGQSMPYDRLWAVAHEEAEVGSGDWMGCQNFSRGAKTASLMAITARLDETTETITLHHPDRADLTINPDAAPDALLDWVRPLVAENRAQPASVLRLDGRSFTDTPFASVSLCNTASHSAVEVLAQTPLQQERWRGNIWFEGASAWAEFNWIGREVKLGTAYLKIEERITRCLATTANTDTGVRDVDTLKALNILKHQEFGIYASVIQSGEVAVGDELELV